MAALTLKKSLSLEDLMTAAESLSWSGASGVGDDLVQSFLQQSHASVDLNHQTSLSGAEVAKLLSEFWAWSTIGFRYLFTLLKNCYPYRNCQVD